MNRTIKFYKFIATLVVITLIFSVYPSSFSYAAVPSLDQIRVALFLKLPNQSLNQTKSATLSSDYTMKMRVASSSSEVEWLTFSPNTTLKLTVNDYKIKMLESASFDTAQKVFNAVKSAGGTPFIVSLHKNSKLVYQVLEGGYASQTEASAAITKWQSNAQLSSLLSTNAITIIGAHAYETGSFSTIGDAQKAAESYSALDVDTAISLKLNSTGKLEYAVQIGLTATSAELEKMKDKVTKAAGTVKQVDSNSSSILLRNEHSTTGSANSSVHLYAYNPQLVVSLSTTEADGVITVVERSNRKYRGSIELGTHNEAMYVINELPFEQYLYSVVAVEMYPSWPIEALKAQAVAARSYALFYNLRFEIAHVVDTTLSQAYYGFDAEHPNTTEAVEATRGEVMLYNGRVVEGIYSSSAGGRTADASEIWGNAVPYLKSVSSPDESSEEGLYYWYRVVLPNGLIGYVREDVVSLTGAKNEAGLSIVTPLSDGTNVRRYPMIETNAGAIAQMNKGAQLVVLEKVIQSNPNNWLRGPYASNDLLAHLNNRLTTKISGLLHTLTISERGPSGRVLKLNVNGNEISPRSPVEFRGMLGVDGSLPSTNFDIVPTGETVILGAGGNRRTKTDGTQGLHIIGKDGKVQVANEEYLFMMDGSGEVRAATKESAYHISGSGNGHGVGMSQYGAYTLAKQGYDYEYILKHYYTGITIAKE